MTLKNLPVVSLMHRTDLLIKGKMEAQLYSTAGGKDHLPMIFLKNQIFSSSKNKVLFFLR